MHFIRCYLTEFFIIKLFLSLDLGSLGVTVPSAKTDSFTSFLPIPVPLNFSSYLTTVTKISKTMLPSSERENGRPCLSPELRGRSSKPPPAPITHCIMFKKHHQFLFLLSVFINGVWVNL